jgi:carbon storage regulator
MLVLTRKAREELVIPESDLVITVLEIHGDRVRLGFSAPSNVRVYRQEVWQRIKSEESGQQNHKSGEEVGSRSP